MIEFLDICKTYDNGKTYAVKDLNLVIENNEFVVFLGQSGSGKTTTLKMINRLIEASSGTLRIDGKKVEEVDAVELRRSIGYVFQGIGLFPHLTIAENIEIVPKLLGWSAKRRQDRARELLDLVGLPCDMFANRYPEQLSGGQQQRIGVARALAADPEYLLMDEPFGALDAVTREKLQQELLHIKRQCNKTFIFVTHDLFEALALGDRIAIFDGGYMQQVGSPKEVIAAPATPFVRNLFERPAQQLRDFQKLA